MAASLPPLSGSERASAPGRRITAAGPGAPAARPGEPGPMKHARIALRSLDERLTVQNEALTAGRRSRAADAEEPMSTPGADDELDTELGLVDGGPTVRRDRHEH